MCCSPALRASVYPNTNTPGKRQTKLNLRIEYWELNLSLSYLKVFQMLHRLKALSTGLKWHSLRHPTMVGTAVRGERGGEVKRGLDGMDVGERILIKKR